MRGPEKLIEKEDNWQTDLGASFAGERVVVRGKDLFTELKDLSWHELLLFMITGRRFKENELELLDKFWMLAISYPDPRVWNNRVAALAGTVRSTPALGVGAACSVSEADIYGGKPCSAAVQFFVDLQKKIESGELLTDCIDSVLEARVLIPGYGRPISIVDERIKSMEEIIKKSGFSKGKHVQLAYEIERVLVKKNERLRMNIGGLFAAVAADMGFSAEEYLLWITNGFNAGTTACYADALDKGEGTLFPLRSERIKYLGKENRTWT